MQRFSERRIVADRTLLYGGGHVHELRRILVFRATEYFNSESAIEFVVVRTFTHRMCPTTYRLRISPLFYSKKPAQTDSSNPCTIGSL